MLDRDGLKSRDGSGALIYTYSISDLHNLVEYLNKLYGSREYMACFDRFKVFVVWCTQLYGSTCIIAGFRDSDIMLHYIDKKAIFAGSVIGFTRGTSFIPHPNMLDTVYRCTRKVRGAVTAKYQGVKAFLYGNDLLAESIGRIYPPIHKDLIVAVIDPQDNRVIGVGRSLYSYKKIINILRKKRRTTPIIKNVFDLGWYLREGG